MKQGVKLCLGGVCMWVRGMSRGRRGGPGELGGQDCAGCGRRCR